MKDFLDGVKSYLIISAMISAALVFVSAIALFLEIQEPTAPIQTIGDVFNIFVIGYYYNGTLLGGITWKWHVVLAVFFGLGHYLDENHT